MVYGVLQLINFAHGDVFMLGAMMGWYASSVWTSESRNPSIAGALAVTLFSMIVCATVGLLIERLAYRPLRGSPRLNALITAIGVSFFLEYGGQFLLGPNPSAYGVLPHRTDTVVAYLSNDYDASVIVITFVVLILVLLRITIS